MKRNVLLLCLSVVNVRSQGRLNQYAADYGKPSQIDIEGLMTNEAPAKYVIEKLQKRGERLDDIVVISSQTTRETILEMERAAKLPEDKAAWLKKEVNDTGKTMDAMTHLEYYQTVIHDYAVKQYPECYREQPIAYHVVDIPNDPGEKHVAEAAVKAAEYVLGNDETVDLYIDYNGGLRYVALMILNIANLMKIRNIEIQEVITMNFDNKIIENGEKRREIIPIQNMAPVFNSGELVAGINEYVNYGRIKTLRRYFSGNETREMKEILDRMTVFSNHLQLCRTNAVFQEKEALGQKLAEYKERHQSHPAESTYEVLFAYVVDDILAGYGPLLTGELPDVIAWCVEKGFVQQALTFFVERMPVYFWDSGIFRPTDQEEKEYMGLRKALDEAIKNKTGSGQIDEKDKDLYKKYYAHYDLKYSWITSYLSRGRAFHYMEDGWYLRNQPPEKVYLDKNVLKDIQSIFKRRSVKFETQISKKGAIVPGSSLERLNYIGAGRAESCLSTEELAVLFVCYDLLKKQRNKANHADDSTDAVWDYDFLCEILMAAVTGLRTQAKG